MAVPDIRLSGDGIGGVLPPGLDRQQRRALMTAPVAVKLGRIAAAVPAHVPRLADYLQPGSAWQPPASSSYAEKARASIARMYANDRYGNCVIADRAHSIGLWTANDSDSGGEVLPTDAEVVQEYQRICGPGDNGCVITRVLDEAQRNGLRFAGGTRKIGGYVAIDSKRPEQVKAAQHLFGAVCLGFYFREAWRGQSTWAPSTSRVVGGHDVGACAYDDSGLLVMSWGRVYRMTWELIVSADVDEMYAVLSPDWTGSDRLSPSGLDVEGLVKALAAVGGGQMPDPFPVPPPPPVPPVPVPCPVYAVTLSGSCMGESVTLSGVATPTGTSPPPVPPVKVEAQDVECHTRAAAVVVAGALFALPGVDVDRTGSVVHLKPKEITPEGWAAILAIVKMILEALGPLING